MSIDTAPVPDHKAVLVHINSNDKARGKGYWKLNASLLEHDSYVSAISETITSTVNQYQSIISYKHLWELIKIRIKEQSIRFSVSLNNTKKTRINKLEQQIKDIDLSLAEEYRHAKFIERQELKDTLDDLLKVNAQGAQIRSRAKWVEEGERSTSYFLRLEKHNQNNNRITRLMTDDGNYVDSDEDILNEAKSFYSKLYDSSKPRDHDIKQYINQTEIPNKLTEEDKKTCEGLISAEECSTVVKNLKLNKSPGLDGLTSEFYKRFWPHISDILIKCYNESFNEQILPLSQRSSVLSLIYKKGDRERLVNYRPISVTNTDYKILAFVLANRLHTVLGKIISTDQAGYVRKRFIGQNIRLVQDVLKHADKYNKNGILLFLDFEKAFDSLEWNFMMLSLEKFNFGSDFLTWIKTLYTHPCLSIKNNGYLSETLEMQRGIRQGCPLSALLFVISIEILALRIKQDRNIEGYTFKLREKTHELKLSQYADDGTLILKDENQVKFCISTINDFGKLAGLKLNTNKTIGMFFGQGKHRADAMVENIKITAKPQKCLGVYVGCDTSYCNEMNWTNKLLAIERLLETWKSRHLTLFGKITIIKCLALPKITHVATNCSIPEDLEKRLSKLFYNFIWGQRERIKRKLLIAPIEQGGVGMIDIQSYLWSLKASWMGRICDKNEEQAKWNLLTRCMIESELPLEIFTSCSISEKVSLKQINNLPQFYKEVCLAFSLSHSTNQVNERADILKMNLWGNKDIFYLESNRLKTAIFFPSFYKADIHLVQDLKFINGKLDCAYIYEKVKDKRDILREATILQKALKPFKTLVQTHTPGPTDHRSGSNIEIKSKSYYYKLLDQHINKPNTLKINNIKVNERDMANAYRNKIKGIGDPKIKEFNYKLINNILPCNKNLKNWHIKSTDKCPVCDQVHDIAHMLFSCVSAQNIWSLVSAALDYTVDVNMIFLGSNDDTVTFTTSVLEYLIYKRFILSSGKNKQSIADELRYYINEIEYKVRIYNYCEKLRKSAWHLKKIATAFKNTLTKLKHV